MEKKCADQRMHHDPMKGPLIRAYLWATDLPTHGYLLHLAFLGTLLQAT